MKRLTTGKYQFDKVTHITKKEASVLLPCPYHKTPQEIEYDKVYYFDPFILDTNLKGQVICVSHTVDEAIKKAKDFGDPLLANKNLTPEDLEKEAVHLENFMGMFSFPRYLLRGTPELEAWEKYTSSMSEKFNKVLGTKQCSAYDPDAEDGPHKTHICIWCGNEYQCDNPYPEKCENARKSGHCSDHCNRMTGKMIKRTDRFYEKQKLEQK